MWSPSSARLTCGPIAEAVSAPRLSVVIPVLGRYEKLSRAIERLERQNAAPGDFELVVAADATEPDLERIDAAIGQRPFATRRLRAPVAGAASARDLGWQEARAPIVLFLDSDVLAAPELVAEHLRWHQDHPA